MKIYLKFLTLISVLLISCNNYKTYYPKDQYVHIYIDNSKIKKFDISLVYNDIDTSYEDKKIYKVDTLNFIVNDSIIIEKNRSYPMFKWTSKVSSSGKTKRVQETTWDYNFRRFHGKYEHLGIVVFEGNDVRIVLKKDKKIIDSYKVNLNDNYTYIINPMSKSSFKYGTVRYGGFVFEELPSNIYTNNFISVEKVDFFLTPPPDTISYTTYNNIDPCMVGCDKTYLEQIK